jgi:hypothetical protein
VWKETVLVFRVGGEAGSGAQPISSLIVTGAFSWGVKRPGLEAGNLPSIAVVKNDWNCTSGLLYTIMSCARTSPEEFEEKPPNLSVKAAGLWCS